MSNTEIYNLIIINARYIMEAKSVEIQLNQITFQLKEHHNFDWLLKLGTVFAVFDQQDSGNISFGVEKMAIKIH